MNIDINEYEIFHHSTKLKNIWLKFFAKTGQHGAIWVMVKLNIVDNTHKIDYKMTRDEDYKENLIRDTTGNTEEDKIFIEKALEYAENKGYLNKIRKKYNLE